MRDVGYFSNSRMAVNYADVAQMALGPRGTIDYLGWATAISHLRHFENLFFTTP
jgi:hypothetical protein